MSKKYIFISLTVLIVVLLIIIAYLFFTKESKTVKIEYKKITFEDMDKIIQENNLEKYYILDVRTEEEYKEKRLPNSILIPDYEIESVKKEIKDKDAYIFVYCRSGRRSEGAVMKMNEMGYANVYDMGGIIDYYGETVSD
jgi:rhodanese-related sulfurtransferase